MFKRGRGRGQGDGRIRGALSAVTVKAGDAGFRIDSYDIFVLEFWVPPFFVLNNAERGHHLA